MNETRHRSDWRGKARLGPAWRDMGTRVQRAKLDGRSIRQFATDLGKARRGEAWQGTAWYGNARALNAQKARLAIVVRLDNSPPQTEARLVSLRPGQAGCAWAWRVAATQGREYAEGSIGIAVRLGGEPLGLGMARPGAVRSGGARQVAAGSGWAGFGVAWQGRSYAIREARVTDTKDSEMVNEIAESLRSTQRFCEQDFLNRYSPQTTGEVADVRRAIWSAKQILRRVDRVEFAKVAGFSDLFERCQYDQIAERSRRDRMKARRIVGRAHEKMVLAAEKAPDDAREKLSREADRQAQKIAMGDRRVRLPGLDDEWPPSQSTQPRHARLSGS